MMSSFYAAMASSCSSVSLCARSAFVRATAMPCESSSASILSKTSSNPSSVSLSSKFLNLTLNTLFSMSTSFNLCVNSSRSDDAIRNSNPVAARTSSAFRALDTADVTSLCKRESISNTCLSSLLDRSKCVFNVCKSSTVMCNWDWECALED
eukprot:CAMPEP_0201604132 /NCGR_PEP_ID=MMETSP0492-20130828/4371_1 /ASSEMBLY_ACC=CAM_ASM_000837 /TAXON_ID=420259 /ORGANISM="Thalassiosira gravida, Strain GMp14c1" /LENGTH=151 /DNA_ID=CAMNT_0048068095 /DNA_START=20 /DNA_END=472 /DNA_ORIENTATION=-